MQCSIVLPVRNGGHYVKECVNSILHQDYPEFELLVLDNCSSDGTTEWLQAIRDDRIKIFRSARPLSIEENWARIRDLNKLEFMTMIGHDDLLEPYYLSEMRKLIQKYPAASLYQTHFSYINENGVTTRPCLPMDEVQQAYEFLACQMCSTVDSTGTGYLMRSADFDFLGGMPISYPNLIFSDYELWIKLGRISFKATSSRSCFKYREHLSVSRMTNGMQYFSAFDIYIQFVASQAVSSEEFAAVVSRYGKTMLLAFCESLSHRLLKTPKTARSLTVTELVEKFRAYASQIIPSEEFRPEEIRRIKYAMVLDRNWLFREVFNVWRWVFRK